MGWNISTRGYFTFVSILVFAWCIFAQTHYIPPSNTGNNMTVLIQTAISPSIDGGPLTNGDEVGVFRPSGLCVGAAAWTADTNCVITVWGDNGQTNDTDGIRPGEVLMFRVWRPSLAKEVSATVTYLKGGPGYEIDGIAILLNFSAISAPSVPALYSPVNGASNVSMLPTLVWHKVGSALSYHVQVSTSNLFALISKEDSSCTDTLYTPGGLAGGATYYWRVKAKNAGGSGAWSEIWNATTTMPSAILRKSDVAWGKERELRLSFEFQLSAASYVSLRIYSLQGKLIQTPFHSFQSAGYHHIPITIADVPKGCSIVDCRAGAVSMQRKISNLFSGN